MSPYHCPICPLIFQYRTEVEWHLREDHRSRADESADLRAELAAATVDLDWERLRQLRSSRATPSVTLLLSTAPAPTMTVLDIARLRQLAERARRRLPAGSRSYTTKGLVEDRLSMAVFTAESQATDRGLALLVNRDDLAIIALPFPPRDRHVVDDRFATRDLEYTLSRYPRYRVLVLGHRPRILEGHARQLSEPADASTSTNPAVGTRGTSDAYRDPDVLLSARVRVAGHHPLIVVGDRRTLERFHRHSRYADDVVTEIPRSRIHGTDILRMIANRIDGIQHEQQSRALAELCHPGLQSQIAWGVHAAWRAVHDRTADRLWVEHDFATPGSITLDISGIEPGTDPAEPVAPDDLIDVLLAKAAELGIKTHLLDKGSLDHPEPVAVSIPIPRPSYASTAPSLAAAS